MPPARSWLITRAVVHAQVAFQDLSCANLLNRPELCAQGCEAVQRTRVRPVPLEVPIAQRYDALSIGERQSRVHQLADELERGGTATNRKGHGHTTHDGEPWILQEHAQPELEVKPGKAHLVDA